MRFNSTGGAATAWTYQPALANGLQLTVVLGPTALYVTAARNVMFAVDKATGAELWTTVFSGWDNVSTGVLVDGPTRAFLAPGTRLLAGATPSGAAPARQLQASQSRTPTRTPSQTPSHNSRRCVAEARLFHPVLAASTGLIISTTLRCLYGVNSTTGRVVWYRTTGDIFYGSWGLMSFTTSLALSADEGTFCGGLSSGHIFCMQSADGSFLWANKITSEQAKNPPMISNGTVFAHGKALTGAARTLTAFDLGAGTQRWNSTAFPASPASSATQSPILLLPAFVSPFVDAVAFSIDLATQVAVVVLDAARGTLLRTVFVPCAPGGSALAADAINAIFIVVASSDTFKHHLYRINASTGSISYDITLPSDIASITTPSYLSLVVGNGALLVGDFTSSLFIYY